MLGALWFAIAGLTTLVGFVDPADTTLGNILRIAIIVLMVVTAFLLVRYDLTKR